PGVNSIPDIFQYNTNDLSIFLSVTATEYFALIINPNVGATSRCVNHFATTATKIIKHFNFKIIKI
ncbi:MAG: hypothetical protein Q8772_01605, partial [Candidatus Phytoplasma australasiaticum]|nr:hypothetical protein [Candidatus Phytoplasma australasiaticum]